MEIGGGEIDCLRPLRRVGKRCHHEIKIALIQADQKVVKGHIHNLKFDAQAIGNLLSQGYVKTGDGVHAVDLGMELEGGIVGAGAEDNLPGSFDLSQTAGLFRGCGGLRCRSRAGLSSGTGRGRSAGARGPARRQRQDHGE